MHDLSITNSITDTTISSKASLSDIIDRIRSNEFESVCNKIRQSDKTAGTQLKKTSLPIFNPCVRLAPYRSFDKNNNNESTGIVQFDVDECDDVEGLANALLPFPQLLYLFRSPSGGLKFGVLTDFISNDQTFIKQGFKVAYELVKQAVFTYASFNPDDAVKNIAQSCFLSFDPKAYLNTDAAPFPVITTVHQELLREEQKRNQAQDDLYRNSQVNGVDEEEVLKALSCIPKTFDYNERLPINLAVISIFGDRALDLLMSHWIHDDRDKLERDIREQIRDSKGLVSVGTLFKTAQEHGYKITSNNKKSQETNNPPNYNQKIYSKEEATQRLSTIIDEFLEKDTCKIVNFEAGAGKTRICIERAYQHISDHPQAKIAFFVATHEIAEQYRNDFLRIIRERNPLPDDAAEFRVKLHQASTVRRQLIDVQHIKGRNSPGMCDHPFKATIAAEKDQGKQRKLWSVFQSNISKICLYCDRASQCPYVQQFNGFLGKGGSNIRIYTHDQLFNQRSLWDSGSYDDVVHTYPVEDDDWTPTHIIVDEDIVGKATGDTYIERISYDNATPLLQNIIHELKTKSLYEVVSLYSEDIKKAHRQQVKDVNEWATLTTVSRTDTVETMIDKLEHFKRPQEYKVITALKKFAESLDDKNSPDTNMNAIFLGKDQGTLYFANRAYIHDRYKEIPTLLLDASANRLVVKSTFGKRFDFESISVGYQDNVKVYQCENKSYSKSSLMEDPKAIGKLSEFIKSKSVGKKFGLITYQNLRADDGFCGKLALATGASAFGYFGNLRGINKFQDLDQLFIVGRHNIGWSLQTYFRQLFGGLKLEKDDLNFERDFGVFGVFRMKSGQHMQISQYTYSDNRMRALDEHFNKAETYQAIHRLRLIHGNKPKEVYILTNEILDVTVDELFRADKTKPATEKRIELIQEKIIDCGYLHNKNNAICEATGLTVNDMKNLKRDGFEERVLSSPEIELIEVHGKDTTNRKVEKSYFVKAGTEPKLGWGFNSIDKVYNRKV